MPNGSISFNPSRASTSNIPTCAVTGSRNICSIGSRWTTLQNTTQRHNSTNLTGSPRDGLPTISAAPRGRRGSAELVTHEFIDDESNVWVTDERAKNGKAAVVMKFSPEGKLLMTLGKPGMPGDGQNMLNGPSGVAVAPNGDIYVADGRGGDTNDRVVKFSKD